MPEYACDAMLRNMLVLTCTEDLIRETWHRIDGKYPHMQPEIDALWERLIADDRLGLGPCHGRLRSKLRPGLDDGGAKVSDDD